MLIFDPPDRLFLCGFGVFIVGDFLIHHLWCFCITYFALVLCTSVGFAASCASDYVVATHNIKFDFDVATATPNLVASESKSLNANTFILSDDGNCYAGYEPYLRTGNDVYPLVEDSDLCPDGYYRSNGACVVFASGGCPSGRYNSATVSTTFIPSEDGNCYSGYDTYSRTGNDIYPLVDSSVLCLPGQYPANGTCTAYSAGTCPENMLNTTTNSSTWTTMTNGACPTNYTEQEITAIEFACDSYISRVTSETPACLLMCNNGLIFTEVNSCAALCNEHNKLKTSTGLEFPMYASKQITPSLNIKVGKNVCYVNLVPGSETDAIQIKYDEQIYHTVN